MSSLAIADSPAHLCYPLQRPKRPLRAAGWPRRVELGADGLRQGEPAVVVNLDRRHGEGLRAGGIGRGREDEVRKGRPEDGSERTSTARNSASPGTRPRAPEIRPLLPLGRLPLALVRPARDVLHEPLQQHGPRVDVDEPALVTRPRRRPRIRSRRPGLPALALPGAWLSWFVRRHGDFLVPAFGASTLARRRAVDARPRPDPAGDVPVPDPGPLAWIVATPSVM